MMCRIGVSRWLHLVVTSCPGFTRLKRKEVDRDVFIGRVTDFDPTIDVEDPELQDWLVEATRLPMDAIDEMRKMAVFGRKLWPKIHQPVLIFQRKVQIQR